MEIQFIIAVVVGGLFALGIIVLAVYTIVAAAVSEGVQRGLAARESSAIERSKIIRQSP